MLRAKGPIPSVQNRVYRSSRSTPPIQQPKIVSRPPVYKEWSEEQMLKAYNAVKKVGVSRRIAAITYGVPKSTLDNFRVLFGSHSGPERYLNDEEEEDLVSFICGCASVGFAKTRIEVIAIVEEVLAQKGRVISVSNGWWEGSEKDTQLLLLEQLRNSLMLGLWLLIL